MKLKFKWQKIELKTRRSKVFGGWIVHSFDHDDVCDQDGNAIAMSESMVFIPDAKHEWEVDTFSDRLEV